MDRLARGWTVADETPDHIVTHMEREDRLRENGKSGRSTSGGGITIAAELTNSGQRGRSSESDEEEIPPKSISGNLCDTYLSQGTLI